MIREFLKKVIAILLFLQYKKAGILPTKKLVDWESI